MAVEIKPRLWLPATSHGHDRCMGKFAGLCSTAIAIYSLLEQGLSIVEIRAVIPPCICVACRPRPRPEMRDLGFEAAVRRKP